MINPILTGETMPLNSPQHPRRTERGAITILTVLGLLMVLTVFAFGMSRNAIRELGISGTVWQAARASEASETGLDWFLLWASKENWPSATAYDRNRLVAALQQLNSSGTWQTSSYLLNPVSTTDTSLNWDRAAILKSAETAVNSDMVSVNSGADFLQAGTGNTTIQSFDIQFRYLGSPLIGTMSGASGGSGNTAGQTTGSKGLALNLYQIQTLGKASIPTGATSYIRYITQREMYATITP